MLPAHQSWPKQGGTLRTSGRQSGQAGRVTAAAAAEVTHAAAGDHCCRVGAWASETEELVRPDGANINTHFWLPLCLSRKLLQKLIFTTFGRRRANLRLTG